MLTYQDFEVAADRTQFIARLIREHMASPDWAIARDAELYDRRKNVTINNYVNLLQGEAKDRKVDISAANNRIASNFFRRLNKDRCAYSLGNGVTFTRKERRKGPTGEEVEVDLTKEALGPHFDHDLYVWAYKALIQKVAFGFWNVDRLYVFPFMEFAPLWDEETGALRAGVRFWRLDEDKPMTAVLYTETGYTTYRTGKGSQAGLNFQLVQDERPYVEIVQRSTDGREVVVGEENYGSLPIIPLWGSELHQSTLIGLREQIDSFDLIRSGFCNDVLDTARIYWILQNVGGMDDEMKQAFLHDIRTYRIANVNTDSFDGDTRQALTPYVQDVPYQSSESYLQSIRSDMYEGFGDVDVHAIAAGSTNDHIDAAYQPMEQEADDFEYQIIEAVQALLRLKGIEDTPQFKRGKVSNVKEQIEAIVAMSPYMDERTVLELCPLITVDQVEGILARKYAEGLNRLELPPREPDDGEEDEPGDDTGEV